MMRNMQEAKKLSMEREREKERKDLNLGKNRQNTHKT